MRSALDNHQLRIGRVGEQFNFLFGIGDGVDDVVGSLLLSASTLPDEMNRVQQGTRQEGDTHATTSPDT